MQIVYDKLFEKLKQEGITQKQFLESGISGSTLNKLRNNQCVTTDTLCRICEYFSCMPDEIMEWIPDVEFEKYRQDRIIQKKQKQRNEIERQILELQAKLKKVNQN